MEKVEGKSNQKEIRSNSRRLRLNRRRTRRRDATRRKYSLIRSYEEEVQDSA
jgi:hypothetical protein